MATKFYLLIKNTELDFFAAGSNWANHNWVHSGQFAYYGQLMDPIKMGNPILASSINDSTIEPPPYNHLHYRGISRKLMPQTISGTFDAVFHVAQSIDTADCYTRLFVYVIDTTGNPFGAPIKAYLINNYEESAVGGGIEWTTGFVSGANPVCTSRRLQAPVTITSYTVPNDGRDYRIVAEIGCVANRPIGPDIATAMRVGARNTNYTHLSDLTVSSSNLTAVPYFEFSGNILLKNFNYPVNHEPESATDMGVGPITVNPVGNSLAEYFQWYKYSQNNTVDRVISVLFCSPGAPGSTPTNLLTYSENDPTIEGPPFYIGPNSQGGSSKKPIMVSTKANGDAYFKTYQSGGAGGGNVGTISVVEAPVTALAGDIMVNVDSSAPNIYDPTINAGTGSVWWRPTGIISHVASKVAYSELGVCLKNGKFAIPRQESPYELYIYNKAPALTLQSRIPLPFYAQSMATDFTYFYVLMAPNSFTPMTVYRISEFGEISTTTWTLPKSGSFGIKNCGVSRDGTIIYFVDPDTGGIGRFNLTTNTLLSSFTSAPAAGNDWAEDIIVMSDGTIVAVFSNDWVYHYATDGTVLHSWAVPNIDHMSHEADDSADRVWLWLQPSSNYIFRLLNLTNGTTIKEFQAGAFSGNGVGQYSSDCNPPTRFGVGSSCTMLTMMTPPIPPDLGGIYFINPIKVARHDSYYNSVEKKIPNPTVRTAFMGE